MAYQPGRFIALEGIDGSGTSTQTRALAAALAARGHRVQTTCEPSRGAIGRMIREQLSAPDPVDAATLALLFAADRLDHVRREITPALAAGAIVLSDRYVVSSLVYQALECAPDWVATLNRQARWPDLCILLDVPAEIAIARVRARIGAGEGVEERYDAADIQRRLADGYRSAARADPRIRVLDGNRSPEAVTSDLLTLLGEVGIADDVTRR